MTPVRQQPRHDALRSSGIGGRRYRIAAFLVDEPHSALDLSLRNYTCVQHLML
jgi:hypothetical protein